MMISRVLRKRGYVVIILLGSVLVTSVYVSIISLVFHLLIAFLAFFAGATVKVYLDHHYYLNRREDNRQSQNHGDFITHVQPEPQSRRMQVVRKLRGKLDMRVSGSAIIDEIIHDMMDYIVRDTIHSWYDYVSCDDQFLHELRSTMQEALVNLSSRVKEIDWTPYLTTQLVDDSATHLRLYRTALTKVKENVNRDLLSEFFDLESTMEKHLCRDMACIDDSHLNDYFQGIADMALYLLLPSDTYACNPVGILAQDMLVHYVLIPTLNLLCDPDFVNQYVIWLCNGFPVTSDTFISVIRTCDNLEEISAIFDYIREKQSQIRGASNREQISAEDHSLLKSEMKSLHILSKNVELRHSQLKEGRVNDDAESWADVEGTDGWQNYYLTPGIKLHTLSIHEVLINSVAVSYYLDYMNTVNATNLLLMYFNLSAWKNLAEQQFAAFENPALPQDKDQAENHKTMMECLKTAAANVFQEFVPENAKHRVNLSDNVVRRFKIEMQTGFINPGLFDDIYDELISTMTNNEKFFPGFLKSKHYIKCLMDLDLLRTASEENNSGSDDDDSFEDEYDFSRSNETQQNAKRSEDYQTCIDCLKLRKMEVDGFAEEDVLLWERGYLERKYSLKAEIIEAGLTSEKGKQFGVYALQVVRQELFDRRERRWHIYRRYSDFYDFHQWIKSKWMRLNKIDFPSKHTFRTTDRLFLERRMSALNSYLQGVLSMTAEQCFGEGLKDALLHFFEPGNYTGKKKQLSERLEGMLVNPLKQSVKTMTTAVKSAPDTFISTLDGFTRIFYPKTDANTTAQFVAVEAIKVGASIDLDIDDNIPLRIVLLLMDEVFDLKQKNQWLRRRIVAFCREILKAMYGDTMNRRIIDHVAFLTNPVKVSGYLLNLERALWPDGQPRSKTHFSTRDTDIKLRTKTSTKSVLFASISDELKRLIGSETTRRGLLCVFDLLQNKILNRRLSLVLLEGILRTLFPDKPLMSIIQRLHYRSNRVGRQRPFIIPSRVTTSTTANTLSPKVIRKKSSKL